MRRSAGSQKWVRGVAQAFAEDDTTEGEDSTEVEDSTDVDDSMGVEVSTGMAISTGMAVSTGLEDTTELEQESGSATAESDDASSERAWGARMGPMEWIEAVWVNFTSW